MGFLTQGPAEGVLERDCPEYKELFDKVLQE